MFSKRFSNYRVHQGVIYAIHSVRFDAEIIKWKHGCLLLDLKMIKNSQKIKTEFMKPTNCPLQLFIQLAEEKVIHQQRCPFRSIGKPSGSWHQIVKLHQLKQCHCVAVEVIFYPIGNRFASILNQGNVSEVGLKNMSQLVSCTIFN